MGLYTMFSFLVRTATRPCHTTRLPLLLMALALTVSAVAPTRRRLGKTIAQMKEDIANLSLQFEYADTVKYDGKECVIISGRRDPTGKHGDSDEDVSAVFYNNNGEQCVRPMLAAAIKPAIAAGGIKDDGGHGPSSWEIIRKEQGLAGPRCYDHRIPAKELTLVGGGNRAKDLQKLFEMAEMAELEKDMRGSPTGSC